MIRRLIDMQASSEIGGPSAVSAYGTSEGVKKEWDTRGRWKVKIPIAYRWMFDRHKQIASKIANARNNGGDPKYLATAKKHLADAARHLRAGRVDDADDSHDKAREAIRQSLG
jgi:hypothetical protein